MANRERGRIKWFSHQEGCGFVRPEDDSPDLYVSGHAFRECEDVSYLMRGDVVEYEVEQTREGPRAVAVVVVRSKAPNGRVKGHVKWYYPDKRYGFIRCDDGLPDVFVHRNDFRQASDSYALSQGALVEFSIQHTSKGPRAVDVVVLDSA